MERFIRKHFWLLSGAFILIAAPVAAGSMQLLTRHIRTRSRAQRPHHRHRAGKHSAIAAPARRPAQPWP